MSVEDVRSKLSIKNIPNIIGDLNYKAINDLREVMYANASSIPTTHGGGHIGLLADAAVYANVATTK